jgi:acyl-CoA synthetase (NDP forming)
MNASNDVTKDDRLSAALDPQSVAVVGASENPEKIGGRPIKYMLRAGYKGRIYPVNPNRAEIQGLKAYPDVASIPEAPDLAIVAVPGMGAVDAVAACAKRGVKVAVVITSGFGEIGEAGKKAQDEMVRTARAAGMRIVGPNTQGIANFSNGAIATFSTIISEVEPMNGPVGIVSQSGAMSVVPYAFLRKQGIGVRHTHATGNESDLTVADFALAVALDPEVKLLLLYLEAIADPAQFARAAEVARERGLPIVALKAGVSARGAAAANSHTGALATEDRVVDAFFRQHGIYRVPDIRSLVNAADLYLKGWNPNGRRLVAISNSGASCVMAADAAEKHGLTLAQFDEPTRAELRAKLPAFGASGNPIDLTAALLTNSGMFSDILPVLAKRDATDAVFVSLAASGLGYDVPRFVSDCAAYVAQTGKPLAVAAPLETTAELFRAAGLAAFAHDIDAVAALGQFIGHTELLRRAPAKPMAFAKVTLPKGTARFLSEAESLKLLAEHGFPTVPFRLCSTGKEAQAAFEAIGSPVAVKACSAEIPHKSEHGLVHLNCRTPAEAMAAFEAIDRKLKEMKVADGAVILAAMRRAQHEFVVGARVDERFGTLVMLGDGGKYVEALPDIALLRYPFSEADVLERLNELRIAPLYAGVRGEPPIALGALAKLAVRLGALLDNAGGTIASIDLNPVMAGERDADTIIVDALIERAGVNS